MTNAAHPSDRPVFVDPSGRRRKLLRIAIAVVAVAVVGYLVLLGIALGGGPIKPNTLLPVAPDVGQPTLVQTSTPSPNTTASDKSVTTSTEKSASSNASTTTTAPTAATTTTDPNGHRDEAPGASNRPPTPGKTR